MGSNNKTGSALLAAIALTLSSATLGEAPSGWTPEAIAVLKRQLQAAPDDALPVLDTAPLDRAIAAENPAETSRLASELALKLARMHLLGAGPAAAGWRIADSDRNVDLAGRLGQALATSGLEAFLAGLEPLHPDYAALRSAWRTEKDPARRAQLALNMERWRWMPRSLGENYLLVNASAFEVTLVRNGQRAGTWPVIVGKPSTPSPTFAATVTGATFNPWWDVPASIVRESVGSLVRRSPALARQRGYVWSGGHYRQRPGPGNALGRVKLAMPNPYKVYLHDTPNKNLFARDVRAFSHGCIRVGDALGFAKALLQGVKTGEQVDAIVASGATQTVDLPTHLPIYVAYFTAGTRADGTLAYYADIYGRDRNERVAANSDTECSGRG